MRGKNLSSAKLILPLPLKPQIMEAPRIPSMFKNRGARAFEYKPVYYDAQKERIEQIKEKYASKKSRDAEESIREKMRTEWRNKRQKSVGRSNFMLLAIIAGLFYLVYMIFKS